MNGAPRCPASPWPTWIEEGVRRILRDAALGELSADLNTAADETLIATGLEAGDGEIAVRPQDIESCRRSPVPRGDPLEKTCGRSHPDADAPSSRQRRSTTGPGDTHPRADPGRGRDSHHRDALAGRGRGPGQHTRLPRDRGRPQHRERIDTPRVRHLFPVPEDADWEVRELKYDH